MHFPKISVITPSYNQGQYLEETILSVIGQGYPNLEYIIMDGGSTDNSVEIINKYEEHITYWESKKDDGQTHAINKGFKMATGDIITWINSDDYYLPGVLFEVGEIYMKNNFNFLAGKVNIVNEKGEVQIEKSPSWPNLGKSFDPTKIYIAQPGTFFKKQLLNTVGYLDESLNYAMDFDFWVRLRIAKIDFTIINTPIANFRNYEGTKSSHGPDRFMVEIFYKYSLLKYLKYKDIKTMIFILGKILLSIPTVQNKIRILSRMALVQPVFVLKYLKKRIFG